MSTITSMQTTTDPVGPEAGERAVTAAAATAGVLPSAEPLAAGAPQPGTADPQAAFDTDLAGAAVAELEGPGSGAIAVLVGADLVAALSSSPLGELDLAAAVQPALDAAAQALGRRVGAARTVHVDDVAEELAGPYTAVPLLGSSTSAAVLVTDGALAGGPPVRPGVGTAPPGVSAPRGIEMLHGVVLDVTVELGRTRMSVRELLSLTPGTVLELDRAAGSPADMLVNGRVVARGEVVVVDEDFGLRVTEIVNSSEWN